MKTVKFISQSDAAFNITLTTDTNSVNIPSIRKGAYELQVSGVGFQSHSRMVTVDNPTTFTVYLDRVEEPEQPEEPTPLILEINGVDIGQTTIEFNGVSYTNPVISVQDTEPVGADIWIKGSE